MLITNYTNTKTNNQNTTLLVSKGESITFSITTDKIPTKHDWFINTPKQSINSDSFTFVVPNEDNVWTIHVDAIGVIPTIGTDLNEISSISWHITTTRIDTISQTEDITTKINSLPINGGILLFNDGIFSITNTVAANRSNIILKGSTNTILNIISGPRDVAFNTNSPNINITYSNFKVQSSGASGFKYLFGWLSYYAGLYVNDFIVEFITDNSDLITIACGGEYAIQDGSNITCTNITFRNINKTNGRFINIAWLKYIYMYNNYVDGIGDTSFDFNRNLDTAEIYNNVFKGTYTNTLYRLHGINFADIHNNILENSRVYTGTGTISVLFTDGGHDSVIRNNIISGKAVGLIQVNYASPVLSLINNIFNGVACALETRAPTTRSNTVYFINNTIYNCSMYGVWLKSTATNSYFTNNIIVNSALYNINISSGNFNEFNYNNVWGAGTSNYAGTVNGTGNISQNPQFADPLNNDFHLKSQFGRWTPFGYVQDTVHSLCIDAGDYASDYTKEPQPNGNRVDIGAYGNTPEASLSGIYVDITPPSVISVNPLTTNTIEVIFSESVDIISSQNIANYNIDNGIIIYSAILQSDNVTIILNTSEHITGINYNITINNISDIPGNVMDVPYSFIYSFIASFITNITVSTLKSYVLDVIDIGKLQYIDRTFVFNNIPTKYIGMNYIQTSNDDKAVTTPNFLEFDVSKDVTVYISRDDRLTNIPTWLLSYIDTGDNIIGGGGTFSIYAKNFSSGHIILGGNEGTGASMYNVIITEQTSLPCPQPTCIFSIS